MRILHWGDLDVKTGGPALSTYLTLKGLCYGGQEAECLMPPLSRGGSLFGDEVNVHFTENVKNDRIKYIPNLRQTLEELGKYDLYHIQGIWQYPGHIVANYAIKQKKPYVITLRGMMYPEAMAHSPIIKKISLLLYQKVDLMNAACIQATCKEEMDHYRLLGFNNPVAILANPIEINGIVDRPIPPKEKIRIGYLGRVHPRKRIERLIYAFANHRDAFNDCELLIIGSDDIFYEQFLRQEVKRLDLSNVVFTGFLTGDEKDKAITDLSVLAVPSDFENFGNIVTEALVRGVPVIASKGMPWQDLEDYHCGWWIKNDQQAIDKTLMEAIAMSEDERIAMGMRGKQLMKDKYSVEVLGEKMAMLYKWILGQGDKPVFVYE